MQSWTKHARHKDTRGLAALWLMGAALSATALTPACSEEFTSCEARRTCPPDPADAEGVDAGASGAPSNGAGEGGASGVGADGTFAGASGEGGSGAGGAVAAPGADAGSSSEPDPSQGGAGDIAVTALEVLSVDPPHGTVDVDRMPMITIEFSERLDPRTITEESVILRSGAGPLERSVSVADDRLTIAPLYKLDLGAPYTVTLSTSIAALAGATLDPSFESTFRVRSGVLGEPVLMDEGAFDTPKVVSNDRGDLLATWSVTGAAIYGAFYDVDTSRWTTPVALLGVPADADEWYTTLNDAGEGAVSWYEGYHGYSVFKESNGWSAHSPASHSLPQSADIEYSDTGVLVQIWRDASQGLVASELKNAYTAWTSPVTLLPPGASYEMAYLYPFGDRVVAAWYGWSSPAIGTTLSFDLSIYEGGKWSPVQQVSPEFSDVKNYPWLDLDGNGRGELMVLWTFDSQVGLNDFDGDVWSAHEKRFTFEAEASAPDVEMNAHGHAVASWSVSGNGIWASHRDARGGWSEPHQLDTVATRSRAFVSESGVVTVAWSNAGRLFTARRAPTDNAWGTTSYPGGKVGAQLPVAIAPSGELRFVWSDLSGVWFNSID